MLNEKLFKQIRQITIPEYIYQIQTSKARLAKYFHKNSGRGKVKKDITEVPKKYKAIGYDLEGYIIDANNNRIVANSISAGKPKYVPINSQMLYSSSGQFLRAKIMKELHSYFSEIFSTLDIFNSKEYPLFIWIDWYAPNEHKTQDIDNFTYIMEKAMFDSLQEISAIPDDSVDYICGQGSLFHEIEDFKDRKLVITFYTYMEKQQFKLL